MKSKPPESIEIWLVFAPEMRLNSTLNMLTLTPTACLLRSLPQFTRILPVLILFFLCHTAYSRVGETMKECKSRYGLPIGIAKERVQFNKNGLDVFVYFHNGKATSIRFSGKITYAMAEELLKANGPGKKWLVDLDDKAVKIWKTDDKELESTFSYATREDVAHLIILSRLLVNAAREVQKEAEIERVEGF